MVDKMIEVVLEYVKTSLWIGVVVDASFSMTVKTVMKSVSLIADAGTSVFVLSLLNAAELPGANVQVMMVCQLVGIPMFVVLLFVSLLINPLTAAVAPVLSLWNAVEVFVDEIPFEMLMLLAY